jgi:prostamide/prostaglandin F2alpha synthase
LDRARDEIEAGGASLTLIGQLTPRHAAHFRRRQGIELRVLADNDRASYKAAGAKMGSVGELIGPKVVAKGALTTLQTGRFQTRTIGHPAQLGGAMVIVPGGTVAWSHMARDASDNASADEILAALAGPAQQHVVT